ncbi:MAG TPA: laccase domain-containing protein, partial [Vicinamibacterales bacterium]|nr:laccase domain-containing protein [Vicinamibacterales bacterium]
VAAAGPSIGPCCYEVGEEVRERFLAVWGDRAASWFAEGRRGRPHLDLWRAISDQLAAAGVDPAAVHVARLCTACRPDLFHSYRRDGPATGRMAGAIRPPGA